MPTITIQQDNGEVITAEVLTDKPLLMALEAVNCDAVPVGCRGGGCGACRIQILSGDYSRKKMSREHVSEANESDHITLACRTLVEGDLTIKLATPEIVQHRQEQTADVNEMMKWKMTVSN